MQLSNQNNASQQPGHYSFPAQSSDENLSVLPTPSERTGRKSYKLSNNRRIGDKKEPVWPPILEEALLDGLRKYRPVSKSGRPLRRFTKRNVSISRHIYRLTGESRTAKQVGSRLQQITESTKDSEIIHLITCRDPQPDLNASSEYLPNDPSSSSPSSRENSFASPNLTNSNTPASSVNAGSPAAIECVEECTSLRAQLLPLGDNDQLSYLGLDADLTPKGVNLILSVNQMDCSTERDALYIARELSDIPCSTLFDFIPTLSIVSWRLSPDCQYTCTFTVTLDGSHSTHVEERALSVISAEHPGERPTFATHFLPSLWTTLSQRSSSECYFVSVDIYEFRGAQSLGLAHKFTIAVGPIGTGCAQSLAYDQYADVASMQLPLSTLSLNNMASTSASVIPDIGFNDMSVANYQMGNIGTGLSSATWGDAGYYPTYDTSNLADTRYMAHQDSSCPDLPVYGFQQY